MFRTHQLPFVLLTLALPALLGDAAELKRIFPRPFSRSDCMIDSYRISAAICIHEYIDEY